MAAIVLAMGSMVLGSAMILTITSRLGQSNQHGSELREGDLIPVRVRPDEFR